MKEISNDIWVERLDKADYQAFLSLRRDYLSGNILEKRNKTTKEALRALKKEIKLEIKWLESQIEIIEESINKRNKNDK